MESPISRLKLLKSSHSVVQSFRRLRGEQLTQSRKILALFSTSGLGDAIRRDRKKRLAQAQQVLSCFRASNLHYFDIFRKAGFSVSEINFSNAFAALLDPQESHQLGTLSLRKILEKVRKKYPQNVDAILAVLNQEIQSIAVYREKPEESTIPDIEIISDKFIIFIENKLKCCHETYLCSSWQTERQRKALEKKAESLGIPLERTIGILLTPEGKLAKDLHFISLSGSELRSSIEEAIAESPSCVSSESIRAFMELYFWQ